MEWWQILLTCIGAVALLLVLSTLLYKQFFKRFYDLILSGIAIILLSPVMLILIVVGAVVLKGNPFFVQKRPGKINKKTGQEKIFSLVKFRTMSERKDLSGNFLPDEERLGKYGKFLRSTSLDELPEFFNIFIGDMSIVGPRPLLVKYLSLYSEEQRHRHDVKPGLTGYAQAHGRNAVSWEKKFEMDVWYTQHIGFWCDVKIILDTILVVLKRRGISSETSATMEEFTGNKEVEE